MSLLREACPDAIRTLQRNLLLPPPPISFALSTSRFHKQSFFYSLVYDLSPPLDWKLPEGRGRLCSAALSTQCTQKAFSRQLISEGGLCVLPPGSLIFSSTSCQPCSKPRGWQGRPCHSGGLWGLTTEANMPETLLWMQGWRRTDQPRGSRAELWLSDTCGGVWTLTSALSQEGHRGHSGREG